MSDARLEMKIPQSLIEDTIRAEIVRQIPDKDKLISEVVKSALAAKKDSYSRTTIFADAVDGMIREEARKVMQEWLDVNRPAIRAALLKNLTQNRDAGLKALVDGILAGVGTVTTTVQVRVSEE